jgi:L-fucose mutarotase
VLKTIDPLLTPDLLWVLAAMGHGDDLALVDANHPAERIARATTFGRCVTLAGADLARAARAILTLLPVDQSGVGPVRRMEVTGDPDTLPPVQAEVAAEVARAAPHAVPLTGMGRYPFYDAAMKSFAIVQVGDARAFGCFLIRKGVIAPGTIAGEKS